MTSHLEETFASMLKGWGIDFEREYKAIPNRRYRWDFFIPRINALVEINGGIWTKGAHSSGVGLKRDYVKNNLAVTYGFPCLYYCDVESMATFEDDYKSLLGDV